MYIKQSDLLLGTSMDFVKKIHGYISHGIP